MLNRLRPLVLIAAFALVALPAAAHAAPPSNDDFANALPLTLGTDLSGTNLDATGQDAQEPTPSAGVVRESDCGNVTQGPQCTTSVWYTFTPPSDGSYTIETCDGGTDLDTVMGVWTGSLGSLTAVAWNDDGGNGCLGAGTTYGSRVTFAATGGTEYHVEVTGYSAAQGSFYVRAYPSGSPPAAAPDTEIGHIHSFAAGKLRIEGDTNSGGRQTASFDFTSSQDGATFECSLDAAAFTPCSSPVSYDGLSGSHTFAVRALAGGKADPTPAVQRFTIDQSGPDTVFTTAPSSPTSDTNLMWNTSGSERQPEALVCSLDAQLSSSYCDPSVQFGPFCNAAHEFRMAEVDHAFNADPTPALSDFTETGGSACTAPTLGSIATTAQSGTRERVTVNLDSGGSGGNLHLDWGTTSAYGSTYDQPVAPGDTHSAPDIDFLQPGTLYHYRATLTTPAGTVDSGDLTFTSAAASGAVPSIEVGAPVAVGTHAAAIPLTVNGNGDAVNQYGVLIDPAGPTTFSSPVIFSNDSIDASSSPQARTIDAVDLEPGTYHVRGFAYADSSGQSSLSPEVTFTVAAQPAPPTAATPLPPEPPSAPQFILKRSSIRLGKITRHSRFVSLTLKGLPPLSAVSAQLNASAHASSLKRLASKRVHANSHGVAKIKIKLSAKARKLLRNKRTKSLTLRITVTPKLQKPTHITLHPKLRR